jgi:hypothetical protein
MFVYAIRSPYTKESYFRRLGRFFDAIDLCKDMGMEQRCNTFAYSARTDYNWAFFKETFLLPLLSFEPLYLLLY